MARSGKAGASGGREVSFGAILLVTGCTLALGMYAMTQGGPMTAFLGAAGGALTGFAILYAYRAVSLHKQLEGPPPPQVLSLPPEQALSVLSAMVNRDGGQPALASEVLEALAAVRERAESDLDAAIVEAEELRGRHPRSPAIPAQLARLHREREADAASAAAASNAITLAVRGGMNSVAAKVYEEFVGLRERFELDTATWRGLARVLAARDQADAAAWCEEQLARTDPSARTNPESDPGASD